MLNGNDRELRDAVIVIAKQKGALELAARKGFCLLMADDLYFAIEKALESRVFRPLIRYNCDMRILASIIALTRRRIFFWEFEFDCEFHKV